MDLPKIYLNIKLFYGFLSRFCDEFCVTGFWDPTQDLRILSKI